MDGPLSHEQAIPPKNNFPIANTVRHHHPQGTNYFFTSSLFQFTSPVTFVSRESSLSPRTPLPLASPNFLRFSTRSFTGSSASN
ncbi:hypothetical protein BT69DRAFT_1283219 [Atractiella rhizophila]|nr:hypothetical protein BT69DRAFT_1291083 [Atractiella rhizophila]KAH8921385.1 hypothetical protein BT69DRAFT_1283219 [Atractiella rhizophila]